MTQEKPKPPLSALIYGEIVYWGTLAGCVVSLIGTMITFLFPKKNYLDPAYVLTALWQGKTAKEIWIGAVGSEPFGHWYLSCFSCGDALQMFGLAMGVFTIIPACFGAAFALLKEKQLLYAFLAFLAGVITTLSMLGVFSIK